MNPNPVLMVLKIAAFAVMAFLLGLVFWQGNRREEANIRLQSEVAQLRGEVGQQAGRLRETQAALQKHQESVDRSAGVSDFDTDGYNLQLGYFVVPQKVELALRLSELDPNAGVANDEREERGIALGYFFNKHAYKLQADYRQLETNIPAGGSVTNDEFRLQYQLIF